MDLQLGNKTAVVTGASRGIGLASARVLLQEGASVALLARGQESLDAAVAGLASEGFSSVLGLVADTTDARSINEAVARTVEQFGTVDILINAAARPGGGPAPSVLDFEEDYLRAELDTKLMGYVRCARSVIPHMRSNGWGRIINIAGNAALQTGNFVGSVRNGSVVAFTKNLADELIGTGIGVVGVHPGLTVTERIPAFLEARAAASGTTPEQVEASLAERNSVGRLILSEEVGRVIAFLASPLSVAVNGDTIGANGGVRGAIRL